MSTRGAFGIRVDGKDKIVYNHSDSYWEELGRNVATDISEYVNSDNGLQHLKTKANELQESLDKDTVFFERGSFSSFIENGVYFGDTNFLYDSLYCEHAYIANLDTEMFEIYKGMQTEKPKKSRYGGDDPQNEHYNDYWGVELINEIPFSCLKEFLDLDKL